MKNSLLCQLPFSLVNFLHYSLAFLDMLSELSDNKYPWNSEKHRSDSTAGGRTGIRLFILSQFKNTILKPEVSYG